MPPGAVHGALEFVEFLGRPGQQLADPIETARLAGAFHFQGDGLETTSAYGGSGALDRVRLHSGTRGIALFNESAKVVQLRGEIGKESIEYSRC